MGHKEKKLRGRKRKQWAAQNKQWEAQNKYKTVVSISDITADGFWIETYREKYYISRIVFPWFRDATDDEIRDVTLSPDVDEYHGDMLYWRALDVDFGTNSIRDTRWVATKNIWVRGVHRVDLQNFAISDR